MADTAGLVEQVRRRLGMRPVLPLEFPIEIGDIGKIGNDGFWKPLSTVRHSFHGVPERVRRASEKRVWEASSEGTVVFERYAKGEISQLVRAPALAKARTEITFRAPDAFVLAARGVTIRTATDLDELIDKIHLAYHTRRQRPEEGRWWKEFVFVFAVADADCFTALWPTAASARVAITPKGAAEAPASPGKLAAAIAFGTGAENVERTNQRNARGRFYRAYQLRPEVLERWREEPWTRSRDVISFAWATPSFEETFAEI
jgi:hypothetical protein